MTSLGETYEKLTKIIRFFVNRAPELFSILEQLIKWPGPASQKLRQWPWYS